MRGWVCFHNLSTVRQRLRADIEPDFVLLGPEGLFVLKVKEGHVTRVGDGSWRQLDRRASPKPTRIQPGPFEETQSAAAGLRRAMGRSFGGEVNSVLFGYGVMLPDMPRFEISSPDWEPDIVYQGADRLWPIHLYVERMVASWKQRKTGMRPLSEEQLERYENYLRANFEVADPLSAVLGNDGDDPVWFTRGQCQALDMMAENDRGLIGGGAGTGKTFLAVEQARRLASREQKTLVLCQNSLLGDVLSRVFAQSPFSQYIEVHSLLNFLFATIKASSFFGEFTVSSRKSSGVGLYYQYFVKALGERDVAACDALIVDQGNDVLNGDALFALDYVLTGGFECGTWYVFYDDSTKADLTQGFESEVIAHLRSFSPVEHHFPVNCRSTQSIAAQTSVISGYPMAQTCFDGDKVKYRWYDEPEEQLEALRKILGVMLHDGYLPEEITVLYPGGQLFLRDGLRGLRAKVPLAELGQGMHYPAESGKVGFASIQAFRGLENRAIVMLGVDRIGEPWADALHYLGMSRARSSLIMFMHSRIRAEYQKQLTRTLGTGG